MNRAIRWGCVALSLLLCSLGSGQSNPSANPVFGFLGIGRSFRVLGSRTARDGSQVGIQRVAFEPKLPRCKVEFRTVETAYVMRHIGRDDVYGATQVYALGGMYGLRVLFGPSHRFFGEYSFGLQFESTRSEGLPSAANVTPVFLFGEVIGGPRPVEIALQLMHISNGYTQKPNFGQDFATILVGFKL